MNLFWTLWLVVAALLAAVVHLCMLGLDGVSVFARYLRRWLGLSALLLASLLGSLGLRAAGVDLAPVLVLGAGGAIALVCLCGSAWPWWRRRLQRGPGGHPFGA